MRTRFSSSGSTCSLIGCRPQQGDDPATVLHHDMAEPACAVGTRMSFNDMSGTFRRGDVVGRHVEQHAKCTIKAFCCVIEWYGCPDSAELQSTVPVITYRILC